MENSKNILEVLREEKFSKDTEKKLEDHLSVKSANDPKCLIAMMKVLVLEQYYIQQKDLESFRIVYQKKNLAPNQTQFFKMMYDGEAYAQNLLLTMAKKLGLSQDQLEAYEPNEATQTYPKVIRKIAESENAIGIAIACGVNFPVWGKMCGKFRDLFRDNCQWVDEDYGFLSFFATPIPNFDEMILELLPEGRIHLEMIEQVSCNVEQLQESEVLFWDGVYNDAGKFIDTM